MVSAVLGVLCFFSRGMFIFFNLWSARVLAVLELIRNRNRKDTLLLHITSLFVKGFHGPQPNANQL